MTNNNKNKESVPSNIIQLRPGVPVAAPAAAPGIITPQLAPLVAEHEALYKEFLPTLEHYQRMAAKALVLQKAIYQTRLTQAFPSAVCEPLLPICVLSAREPVQRFNILMEKLAEEKVNVTHILYDERSFNFHLFANLPPVGDAPVTT